MLILFSLFFRKKKDLVFHMNPLLGRGFTWNIKPYFLRKIKVKKIVVCWLFFFFFFFCVIIIYISSTCGALLVAQYQLLIKRILACLNSPDSDKLAHPHRPIISSYPKQSVTLKQPPIGHITSKWCHRRRCPLSRRIDVRMTSIRRHVSAGLCHERWGFWSLC